MTDTSARPDEACVQLQVPLDCLVGTALVGYVGSDFANSADSPQDADTLNHAVDLARLVFVCAPQEPATAAMLAVVAGTTVLWRRAVHVEALAGTSSPSQALRLRVRVPLRAVLDALSTDTATQKEVEDSARSADSSHELVVKPVWHCGRRISSPQEPLAGTGWIYSWKVVEQSAGKCFAVQEWGMVATHPCRVVACSPPDSIFDRAACVPLVECPTVQRARCCLCMLGEIEHCSALQPPALPAERRVLEAGRLYKQLVCTAAGSSDAARVFGVPLEELVQREQQQHSTESSKSVAPHIVRVCCADVRERCKAAEGVMRQSGSRGTVNVLHELCDRGLLPNSLHMLADMYTSTELLKSYLKSLPEPLVPWDIAQELVACTEGRLVPKQLKDALDQMGAAQLATLWEIVCAAVEVLRHQEQNKMTPHNLAVCLALCLTWPPETDIETSGRVVAAFSVLFEHTEVLLRCVELCAKKKKGI